MSAVQRAASVVYSSSVPDVMTWLPFAIPLTEQIYLVDSSMRQPCDYAFSHIVPARASMRITVVVVVCPNLIMDGSQE
jgi:hypothetical protein